MDPRQHMCRCRDKASLKVGQDKSWGKGGVNEKQECGSTVTVAKAATSLPEPNCYQRRVHTRKSIG